MTWSIAAPRWFSTCLAVALWCCAGLTAGRAEGQGFGGQISYTGSLGPVNHRRPLCLCLFTNPDLTSGPGCLILETNPTPYNVPRNLRGNYYLIAFLDLHKNERHDPDEPFEIYLDHAAPPGDLVSGQSGNMNIDFTFGDENLPGVPTPTPTDSPTPTPSQSPTPPPSATATRAASPTPQSTPDVAGDCDGNGSVTIDEVVRGVAIALQNLDFDACPPADLNGDGAVHVDELIVVVNAALGHRS